MHGCSITVWDHIETLLRRAISDGIPAKRLMLSLAVFRGMPLIEDVHPLQGGYLRRNSPANALAPERRPRTRCFSMSSTGPARS